MVRTNHPKFALPHEKDGSLALWTSTYMEALIVLLDRPKIPVGKRTWYDTIESSNNKQLLPSIHMSGDTGDTPVCSG